MYYPGLKIKRRQVQMAAMTVVSMIVGVVSIIDNYWIASLVGRICQFFYWGFFKIFNGVDAASTPTEIYEAFAYNEAFRAVNPLLTMEIVIMLSFFAVVASSISIVIEKAALKFYPHFTAVHGVLFGVSIVEWIVLPVLIMQFFKNSPIVLGVSESCLYVLFHLWFYLTLLTYLTIGYIYDVTGRYAIYEIVHDKLKTIWTTCFKVWKGIATVSLVVVTVGISLILMLISSSSRIVYRDTDGYYY